MKPSRHSFFIVFLLFTFIGLPQQRHVPDWAKGAFWYQIFPERFCNGDTANDPDAGRVFENSAADRTGWKPYRWTSNWFGRDEWELNFKGSARDAVFYRRYGGDFAGILKKLDYIKTLGVNAIYLNPVFDAVSLHKYDGSTFHHMDVHFGPDPVGDKKIIASETPDNPASWKWTASDKQFLELLHEAHKRGMRVIIDGVFNHTGTQFWAFKDVASRGMASPYYDWYQIRSLDDPATPSNEFDYKGWWNVKSLPELNRTAENLHPAVKEYIFAATRRWMDPDGDGNTKDGIDGWRLDVAREVPLGFWKEWSALVKKINPNAVIVGELWELSPDFVAQDGPFDAVMNYPFTTAVYNFFIKNDSLSTDDFIASLKKIDGAYPDANLDIIQNLMDSHDTERLLSMIANPGRDFARDADEKNPLYNPGKPKTAHYERQKLVAAFQFLYRGAPMVYYGDEAGMWGATDPHCRKPMVWDELLYDDEVVGPESGFSAGIGRYPVKVDKNLISYYKRLASMRNSCAALREGKTEFIRSTGDKIVGFTRTLGDEKAVVFFNLGKESEIIQYDTGGKEVIDMMLGDVIKVENHHLRFPLWANSFSAYLLR